MELDLRAAKLRKAHQLGIGYAKAPEGFDRLFHHALGHEWFGNQLTAAAWDDFWLHEGYDAYMQPLYARWREGAARYAVIMDQYRNKIQNRAPLVSGKQVTEEEVYSMAGGGPGSDIYYKGAWLLHTLRYPGIWGHHATGGLWSSRSEARQLRATLWFEPGV